jgi:hypothetical protein
MNGRVYDYNVGRFLSVDPYIQGSGSQGINPYSYLLNNPLAGTDPSGYTPDCNQGGEVCGDDKEPKKEKREVTGDELVLIDKKGNHYIDAGDGTGDVIKVDEYSKVSNGAQPKTDSTINDSTPENLGGLKNIAINSSDGLETASILVAPGLTTATGTATSGTATTSAAGAGARALLGGGLLAIVTAIPSDSVKSEDAKYKYVTYIRINSATGQVQVYAGRTGGYGTPQEIVNRRALGQTHLKREGFGSPIVDRWSNVRASIKGREQMLIDFYGGARSVGGTARNAINGVADYNPNRVWYMFTARSEFGELPDNSPARFRLDYR